MKRYLPFIFILLVIMIAGDPFGGKAICDYCKKEIKSGQYIEADGKYFHPVHFLCDNCGDVIGNGTYFRKDGKHYCRKCYEELFGKKCGYCGDYIDGKVIIYDGQTFHDSCFPKYQEYEKEHFKRCEYCGDQIKDLYDIRKSAYPDGRHVCLSCQRTAVKSHGKAEQLMQEAIGRLKNAGIVVDEPNIAVHIVNKNELKQVSMNKTADREGLTSFHQYTDASGHITKQFEIFILDNIPETFFLFTVSHELMHVWQYSYSPDTKDPAFCEGSCNYAAYLVLKQLTGDHVRTLMKVLETDSDPYYGQGYRRVKKLVQDKGKSFWLNHLKSNKNFPSGY